MLTPPPPVPVRQEDDPEGSPPGAAELLSGDAGGGAGDESSVDPAERAISILLAASPTVKHLRQLHLYRQAALKALWGMRAEAEELEAKMEKERKESSSATLAVAASGSGLFSTGGTSPSGNQAARLTLVLLMPLLSSQSKVDATLCRHTATAMSGFLTQCEPGSLSDMPAATLDSLEALLRGWLGEGEDAVDAGRLMDIACSLLSLSFAR